LANNNGLKLCLAPFWRGRGRGEKTKLIRAGKMLEIDWELADDLISLMKKYNTLYVDLAYFLTWRPSDKFCRDSNKIIPGLRREFFLGTDWYMIMLDSHSLSNVLQKEQRFLFFDITASYQSKIPTKSRLWTRFTMVTLSNSTDSIKLLRNMIGAGFAGCAKNGTELREGNGSMPLANKIKEWEIRAGWITWCGKETRNNKICNPWNYCYRCFSVYRVSYS